MSQISKISYYPVNVFNRQGSISGTWYWIIFLGALPFPVLLIMFSSIGLNCNPRNCPSSFVSNPQLVINVHSVSEKKPNFLNKKKYKYLIFCQNSKCLFEICPLCITTLLDTLNQHMDGSKQITKILQMTASLR